MASDIRGGIRQEGETGVKRKHFKQKEKSVLTQPFSNLNVPVNPLEGLVKNADSHSVGLG